VIDCSGDADVAHLAGARTQKLPREHMMGVTTVFNVSGVDCVKFMDYNEKKALTYADWTSIWDQTTSDDGKENQLKSPVIQEEITKASETGLIPSSAELNAKHSEKVLNKQK